MSSSVICRIEANGWGYRPPRDSFVEARAEQEGFSVWFADAVLKPDATQIARRYSSYDAGELARIILDHRLASRDELRWPVNSSKPRYSSEDWRKVTVTGEHGLKAHLLTLAFAQGWSDAHWLSVQSDAAFDMLSSLCGETLSNDWRKTFFDILVSAEELGYDLDALSLLHSYGLAPSVAGLNELHDALHDDWKRQREAREAGYKQRHFPGGYACPNTGSPLLDDEIARILAAFTCSMGIYRVSWPPELPYFKELGLREYLEEQTIAHGRVPSGRFRFRFFTQRILGQSEDAWGETDLDIFAARAAEASAGLPLPKPGRFPRLQREPIFEKAIAAIACQYAGITALDERTPPEPRRNYLDMASFLKDYVTDYERLPRGKLRPTAKELPGFDRPPWRRSFPVAIDFDDLRKRAGVADDVAEPDVVTPGVS